MLVKLGEDRGHCKSYIIDSNNKDDLLKVISQYVNKAMYIELINTKEGGYSNRTSKAREYILNYRGEYRTWYEKIIYSKINGMCNYEKTVYDFGINLFLHFNKIESACKKTNSLIPLEELNYQKSDLSDISLDFPKYEEFKEFQNYIEEAKQKYYNL